MAGARDGLVSVSKCACVCVRQIGPGPYRYGCVCVCVRVYAHLIPSIEFQMFLEKKPTPVSMRVSSAIPNRNVSSQYIFIDFFGLSFRHSSHLHVLPSRRQYT